MSTEIQPLSFRTIKALLKRNKFSVCSVLASTWNCLEPRSTYDGQFDVYPEKMQPSFIWVKQVGRKRKHTLQDVAKFLRKSGYKVGRAGKSDTRILVTLQK